MKTRSLRFPDEIDERLTKRAAEEHRSVQGTVLTAVELYLDGESVAEPDEES